MDQIHRTGAQGGKRRNCENGGKTGVQVKRWETAKCVKRRKRGNQCQARENRIPIVTTITHERGGKQATIRRTRTDATGAKFGICSHEEAREDMHPVPSAGKQATGSKCGKISKWLEVRENRQRGPSAGKQAIGSKRGKTSNRFQAPENRQLVSSAGKHT